MAIVRVIVHGKGCVHDWVHSTSICNTTKDVYFTIGQQTDFRASPADGWDFQKYCNGETPPYCVTEWFLKVPIQVEYGEVHAYFTENPAAAIERERQERQDADKSILDKLASQGKAVDLQIMGVLGKIQDALSAVQQEAQARIKAIVDLEARIKAWISEMVFELLLKNLDAGTREWRKKQI